MKVTPCILLLMASTSFAATQVSTSGSITALRTQTTHHTVTASQGETIFKLSNAHDSECTWLSVGAGNDTAVSVLLSAQAQKQNVQVWYFNDVKSEAWSTACQVANISLLGN